jgi:hypothetical protein
MKPSCQMAVFVPILSEIDSGTEVGFLPVGWVEARETQQPQLQWIERNNPRSYTDCRS